MKTRERILHQSLALFNELGEPNVTTLLIADELEISPGNLYYHFKSKTDILKELFDWYEHDILQLLGTESSGDLEDHWFFLHLIFETIAKYRFIYKDVVTVMERYDIIKPRFRKVLLTKRKAAFHVLKTLQEQGTLNINENELEALGESIILTTTFWLNYSIISGKEDEESTLARGVYQVITLLVPYLSGEQRALLDQLKESYL